MLPWTTRPTHRAWLDQHVRNLLDFGRAHVVAPGGGAAYLGDDGLPWTDRGVQTWITCRTVHVYALGADAPPGLLPAAERLFDRATTDGWDADGAEGFVYTTDWTGTPIVRDRMHWVAAEATAAADTLHRRTGEDRYAELYARWWDHIVTHVIDHEHGSWHHELSPTLEPAGTVWPGKPDLYHAVQAALLPRLPLGPSIARAVADGQVAS